MSSATPPPSVRALWRALGPQLRTETIHLAVILLGGVVLMALLCATLRGF